jgi:hypothetical protein
MDERGRLVVTPETPLESYALSQWNKNYGKGDESSVLMIGEMVPTEETE